MDSLNWDWIDFLQALALLLVLEGIVPFVNPSGFRNRLMTVLQLDDRSLRFMGLTTMVLGVLVLYWIR
jgi:uncharacterized protein